jgi:hypothetical protein
MNRSSGASENYTEGKTMLCPNCGKSLWFVRSFCPFCKTGILAPRRPKSITIISWLAIVAGGGSALVLLSPAAREVMAATSTLAHLLTFASIGLQTLSGLVMLRGFNWGRWAFIVTNGYNQLSRLAAGHWNPSPVVIVGLLLVATACYYLFRPAANAFFSGAASPAEKLPAGGPSVIK